jgi:hypothetical protein
MSDLRTLARHLEALNAIADAAHTHQVKCVVSFGTCPVHGLRVIMQAPYPAPPEFSAAVTAAADAYDFEFQLVEAMGTTATTVLLFTPSLSELGCPVPDPPFPDTY